MQLALLRLKLNFRAKGQNGEQKRFRRNNRKKKRGNDSVFDDEIDKYVVFKDCCNEKY